MIDIKERLLDIIIRHELKYETHSNHDQADSTLLTDHNSTHTRPLGECDSFYIYALRSSLDRC